MNRTKRIYLAALAVLLSPMAANADMIVVNSGSECCTSGGTGTGRAQGILANENFTISSLGIYGALTEEYYDVVIYASTTGSDVGAVLANVTAASGGTSLGWNDINISFSFSAGLYYVVNWRPSDGGFSDWGTLQYFYDQALPVTVGPLTLVQGIEGFHALNSINFLHPNFRYNVEQHSVPEPGTLALLGLGLVGMAARRRKTV